MQSYLRGASTMDDCADWLSGVNWDDPELTKDQIETLGGFVLVLTEISEGLREEPEFRREVANFVATRTGFVYEPANRNMRSVTAGTATTVSKLVITPVITAGSVSQP